MECGTEIDRPDDEGRRPLHEAAFFGSADMVKFLTQNGALMDAPIHPFGHTALYLAVQQGHTDVIKNLIALGARLSVEDRLTGQGLLHLAAAQGDIETAGLLIAAGSDVFKEDKKGMTARDHAARNNNHALEAVLLKVMQHQARH
jgi:ankyrin repeat protein